jgi:hypothetical protein
MIRRQGSRGTCLVPRVCRMGLSLIHNHFGPEAGALALRWRVRKGEKTEDGRWEMKGEVCSSLTVLLFCLQREGMRGRVMR